MALLLASIVGGARLFASAGHTTEVWAAAANLSPGEALTPQLVLAVRVGLGETDRYYISAARPLPAGYVVTRAVGAHELIPFAALSAGGAVSGLRVVALPVALGHFDPNLAPGDRVDVYETARSQSGVIAGPTRRVVADVTVTSRTGGVAGFSGSTVTVTLAVPESEVSVLVAAAEAGGIDLVDVPAGGQ
ncbi:MAG: CpaB family protein [Mycobacteriales bacterium]